MKYEMIELMEYLPGVCDVMFKSFRGGKDNSEAVEKIKSKEFSELCRDLVASFHANVNLTDEEVLEKIFDSIGVGKDYRIVNGYLFAIGVVAASPALPERSAALALTGKLLKTRFHRELFPVISESYRHLIKQDSERRYSIESNAFNDAVAGGLMLTDLTAGWYHHDSFIKQNLTEFSEFFENYEKTRSYSPVWEKAAPWINDVFTRISEDPSIGRKNPDIAKVLRLTKDGADLVSVSDCVEATKKLFQGLVHPDRSDCAEFIKNLDILDDHSSFYSVAFQSELLGNLPRGEGIQRALTYWPHESRDNFRKNFATLAQRIEGKVADVDIILCGLLLNTSVLDSMILKDRAQGKSQWLESAILEKTRNGHSLMDPDSVASIVMDTLLSRYEPEEVSAFWRDKTGGDRYISEQYRRPNPSEDHGYGR
jgi:hypothetical protein